MSQKKTTKQTLVLIGKVGAIVSLVLLVFAAIGTAFGFLGLVISPIVNWSWLQSTITDFASSHQITLEWNVGLLSLKNAEVLSLKTFLTAGSTVALLVFARALFSHIEKDGTPFTDINVKLLVDIGIVSLIQAFAVPLFMGIVIAATNTQSVFADSSESGASLVMALFVFALSLVFKYGVELQKEADTTL